MVNVVITYYETMVVVDKESSTMGALYLGPNDSLKTTPHSTSSKPEDDLFASIVLVLNMLFPLHFVKAILEWVVLKRSLLQKHWNF